MTQEWNSLSHFTKWWWREGQPFQIPDNPHKDIDVDGYIPMFRETVLFREGRFQVEQIILFPNVDVPSHRHPNLDTYECHVAGAGEAWIEGVKLPYTNDYTRHPRLRRFLIRSDQMHWGVAHTMNIVISFQQWFNDVPPTFITDDWDEQPCEH